MTTQEFSNEFDVLYNNIMSNQAPGLNEYEKSVFLTKAQYEIVKNYFNPKGNKYQEGFDGNQKRQIDFSSLLRVDKDKTSVINPNSFDDRSYSFPYNSEAWIAINESVKDDKSVYQIVPIAYNEYSRLMSKPYKYPLKNQAWRMFNKNGVVTVPTIVEYTVDGLSPSQPFKIANNTSKLINFILKGSSLVSKDGATKVVEKESYITIEILLPLNIPSSSWWSKHLASPSVELYEKNIDEMTGPWNSNPSIFPSFRPTEDKVYTNIIIPPATNTSKVVSEVIGKFDGTPKYTLRYLTKPTPIIIRDLTGDGVSIENRTQESECILPEELHPEILQRAVELAKAAYQGDINSTIEMGKRSE